MFSITLPFVLLLASLKFVAATTYVHDQTFVPDVILRGTSANVSQACINRLSVLLNGTSPGPEVRIPAGKTTWIRVYNDMDDHNLTVHWHGLAEGASPFSDGTPQASQWPIPPLHYFDYEVHPKVEDAGTYFYHSHVGFQAVSAAGPLIVEDVGEPPYTYADERIIFFSDLFDETDDEIQQGLQANPFVWSGETNNVLVNGYGITPNGSATGPSCSLSVINVEPDTTYRFRFIAGTALSFISFAFQDHPNLYVIEADGQYTKPYLTSYLQMGEGQRFSVLFKTKSLAELNAANASAHSPFYLQMKTLERPTVVTAYALLSYNLPQVGNNVTVVASTLPASPPLTLPNTTYGFLDYELQPLTDNDFPSLDEVTRRVTITVQQIINGDIIWAQNGLPWTESYPRTPYLVSLYENRYTDALPHSSTYAAAIANGGMDNTTRTFPAEIGEVLEIVIQNSGATNGGLDVHPFHAHGKHYWDLGSGNGTYNVTANEQRLAGTQPVLRDTTMLYRYGTTTTPGANAGWRAWRLRVKEPGVWMIHCHTLQHMIMGMQTVWVFGDAKEVMRIPYPEIQGYLVYGGEAYGNSTHDAVVNHFYPS